MASMMLRTPTEYAAGHIAGSRNIPLGRLAGQIAELPASQPAIVYCQGASRSPRINAARSAAKNTAAW